MKQYLLSIYQPDGDPRRRWTSTRSPVTSPGRDSLAGA
jgi:hypothetical protein